MSTAARKARKRAGIPFTKAPKQGTPLHERYEYTELVPSTKQPWLLVPIDSRRLLKALQARAGK